MTPEDFLTSYCGTSSLNIWENGSLSPCFQDTVLWCGLYLLFIVVALVYAVLLLRKPTNFPVANKRYYLKIACHILLILSPVATLLSFFFVTEVEIFQATYYTATVIAWTGSLALMVIEYSSRTLHNWVLKGFWTTAFLLGALRLQTVVSLVRNGDPVWEAFAYFVILACMATLTVTALFLNSIPGVKEDDYHKLSEEERQVVTKEALSRYHLTMSVNGTVYGSAQTPLRSSFHEPSLEDSANIFSQIIYSWLSPLLKIGNQRVLEDQDLPALTATDTAEHNSTVFEDKWAVEARKPDASLTKTLARCFGLRFMLAGFIKLLQDALVFVGPLCLNRIVAFIEEAEQPAEETTPMYAGFLYVLVMTMGSFAQAICMQSYFFLVFRVSMKVRSAVVTAVYNKAFVLNNASRQGSTVGEIVNHMSIDTQRLMDLIPFLHQLWSGPLQIILCLVALGFLLGWSLLAGISLMVLMIPLNGLIIRKLKGLQKTIMAKKDERIRLTNEVLQGIRVIKFFSWEESFQATITAIRDVELTNLRKAAYLGSVVMFMWMSTPLFVSIVTFTTYVLVGNVLTATTAFTSLALFNILRFPLNMLPTVITSMVDANISIKRLHKYLVAPEMDTSTITRGSSDDITLPAITIENGTFVWTGGEAADDEAAEADEETAPKGATLSDIFLQVAPGELVAICGSVGSGKSSLLGAMLGDIDCTQGHVEINGKLAYAAQNAWIQNATIRDNIIFGKPFDQRRYNKAVRVCQLEADLQIFPEGDMTEIGEKGINLSGGQKQRVSLARAVYADADIYLMDDPLSAVDAHVGLAIFDKCISEALRGKTRVLVTHQLQHMHKVDRIAVLKDGHITEYGSYQELMDNNGEFAALMKKHVKGAEEGQEKAASGEGEDDDDAAQGGNLTKNKLIAQEERQVGQVSSDVYMLYATSLGGVCIVLVLLVFFAMEQISKVSADWWLSWWSDNPGETNSFYIGIYAAIGFVNAFFVLSRAILFAYCSLQSAQKLHESLLKNILHTPMSFFDTTPAGRILNRFSKDQYCVDQTLPRTFSMFTVILFASGAILLVIGAVTPFFLTAVIPLAYIYVTVQKYYIRSSREIKRLDSVSRSPIFSHFDETLNGVSTIRAFERRVEFQEENQERLDQNQRAFFINVAANRWLGLRLELLGTMVVGLASLFCVIERDNIDPGSAGLSLTYALQTTALLNWLVRMYTETESQMVAVERLVEYSNIPREAPPIVSHNRPAEEWPSRGEIVFDHLQLRYREGLELILKDITCTIKSKEKIGVVGRTGAGKSTLMLALFRLVEPAAGSISIDGVDIAKIGLADLRSRISIIPQDPTLFTGTFRTNLDPFNQFADDQILRVLDSVHLRNHVDANGGLNATVAEGGGNISVGQRQLMCLARALLRRSRVIVMDEATASVDFETDSLIQETIRTEFAECTVLIIAHRIHTIESCDRVMVLESGTIAEFDDPRVLKKQDSLFRSMVSSSGTSQQID